MRGQTVHVVSVSGGKDGGMIGPEVARERIQDRRRPRPPAVPFHEVNLSRGREEDKGVCPPVLICLERRMGGGGGGGGAAGDVGTCLNVLECLAMLICPQKRVRREV